MQRIGVLTGRAEGFNLPALRFLVLQLNRLQQSFEYEILRTDDFSDPMLDHLVDWALVDRDEIRKKVPAFIAGFTTHLNAKNKSFSLLEPPPDYFVLLTLAKYKHNYFSMREGRMSVLALGNWDARMAPPTILEFILTLILRDSVAAASPSLSGSVHAGTKGCLCDFTQYPDETRFRALGGFVCSYCRNALITDGLPNVADEVTRILDKRWLGKRSEPASTAAILSKFGSDIFLTKGLKPSLREKIFNTLQEQITKDVLRIFVELIIAALLLWLGLKPIVTSHGAASPRTETRDLVAGVIGINALYIIVGLLAIAGGLYLASRSSRPLKTAGVLATLTGALTISATLIKDFKLFGSLVEKVQIDLGRRSAPVPKMDSTARACVVGPFGDGDAHIPARTNGGAADLAQRASQCAQQVAAVPHDAQLLQITLVGHVDTRELGRSSSRNYGSNFNLAYQRAIAVLDFVRPLAEAASSSKSSDVSRGRIAVLVAGPQNVGPKLNDDQLGADRSVEIRTIWLSLSPSSPGPPSP